MRPNRLHSRNFYHFILGKLFEWLICQLCYLILSLARLNNLTAQNRVTYNNAHRAGLNSWLDSHIFLTLINMRCYVPNKENQK
jgi:hypothetical protein